MEDSNTCREHPGSDHPQRHIMVCLGRNCRPSGGTELMEQMEAAFAQDEDVQVKRYLCFGACDVAPNVVVSPDRLWYSFVLPSYAEDVIEAIRRGEALSGLANHVRPEIQDAVLRTLEKRLAEGWQPD